MKAVGPSKESKVGKIHVNLRVAITNRLPMGLFSK